MNKAVCDLVILFLIESVLYLIINSIIILETENTISIKICKIMLDCF